MKNAHSLNEWALNGHAFHYVPTGSGPSDYAEDKGDDRNDQEDMDHSARTIHKESQYPTYDQNDSDDVQ